MELSVIVATFFFPIKDIVWLTLKYLTGFSSGVLLPRSSFETLSCSEIDGTEIHHYEILFLPDSAQAEPD